MDNGVKITQMPKATTVNSTTVIAGVSNGANEQIPIGLLATKNEVYTKDEVDKLVEEGDGYTKAEADAEFVAQDNALTESEFNAIWNGINN